MQDNKVLWGIITTVLVIVFTYSLFFSRPSYIVTFDSNGGTIVAEQNIRRNDSAERPEEPIREGYRFNGWTNDDETYNFDRRVTENITLIARWEVMMHTITFDSNQGSEVESITIRHGEVAQRPDNPTRSNHRFSYWRYNDEDGERFDWNEPITEDISLRARWQRR